MISSVIIGEITAPSEDDFEALYREAARPPVIEKPQTFAVPPGLPAEGRGLPPVKQPTSFAVPGPLPDKKPPPLVVQKDHQDYYVPGGRR